MAITATYKDGSMELENAILRIDRIWGSKTEHWNAWVGVYASKDDIAPSAKFSITAEYVDGVNPYIALYEALGNLTFLKNVIHDVGVAKKETNVAPKVTEPTPTDAVVENEQEQKPKPRTRKPKK